MQVFTFLSTLDASVQLLLIGCIFVLLVLAGCSRKVARNLIAFFQDLRDLSLRPPTDHTAWHQPPSTPRQQRTGNETIQEHEDGSNTSAVVSLPSSTPPLGHLGSGAAERHAAQHMAGERQP